MKRAKFLCLAAAALFCAPAFAYVDPGSGGALITALLGAIGAAGYTLRKYFYKIKNFFLRKKDK